MKTLRTYQLDAMNSLDISASHQDLSYDAPAMAAVKDFSTSTRMAVHADMPAPDAYKIMVTENSAINYVINDRRELLGIVSRDWLSNDNLLRYSDKAHTPAFWSVFDMMLPISELLAVDEAELRDASVADVLQNFRTLQRDFLLVLDADAHIRGLLSAEDVMSRLQSAPPLRDKGGNVLDILRQLRQSHGLELRVING